MAQPNRRLLFVSPRVPTSFVFQDVELLRPHFDVRLFVWRGWHDVINLYRALFHSDAVLAWFAGRHSVVSVQIAQLLDRPSAIIIGGYEVEWIPEIRYGIPPRSLWWTVVSHTLRRATKLITVSESSERSLLQRLPQSSGRIQRIFNGVDTARFNFEPGYKRRGVLTVGGINRQTIERKGLRLFCEAALRMPDVPFVVVGPVFDEFGRQFIAGRPSNVQWMGPLHGEELLTQFRRASVYVQGSLYESFSLSTAESMACGCIPVVSNRGALPEVVGNTGICFKDMTSKALAQSIREALQVSESNRLMARRRIVENFDIKVRQRKLSTAVLELISQS